MQRLASWNVGRLGNRAVSASSCLLALLLGMAACSDDNPGPGGGSQDAAGGTDSTTDAPAQASDGSPGAEAGPSPDGTTAPETAAPDAVPPDAKNDTGDACAAQPIWPQNGAGFTYERSGGFVAPPPPDSGCNGVDTTYQFSVAARTLTKLDCNFSGRTAFTVHLSDGATAQIVTSLQGLTTSCPVNNCGADAPDMVLTVQATSGSPIAYNGDFYANCSASSVLPPFISFASLLSFEGVLNGTVTSACRPDGGGDAGTCSQGLPDGGATDAGTGD